MITLLRLTASHVMLINDGVNIFEMCLNDGHLVTYTSKSHTALPVKESDEGCIRLWDYNQGEWYEHTSRVRHAPWIFDDDDKHLRRRSRRKISHPYTNATASLHVMIIQGDDKKDLFNVQTPRMRSPSLVREGAKRLQHTVAQPSR